MQIKFNFNNFARVCHSLAACCACLMRCSVDVWLSCLIVSGGHTVYFLVRRTIVLAVTCRRWTWLSWWSFCVEFDVPGQRRRPPAANIEPPTASGLYTPRRGYVQKTKTKFQECFANVLCFIRMLPCPKHSFQKKSVSRWNISEMFWNVFARALIEDKMKTRRNRKKFLKTFSAMAVVRLSYMTMRESLWNCARSKIRCSN